MIAKSELMDELRVKPPNAFLLNYVLSTAPFIFKDTLKYNDFRAILGSFIEVDMSNIVIIGSASIGFSLNPEKNFREFSSTSDVDIAIISPYFFLVAWRFLRNNSHKMHALPYRQKESWKMHANNYVYWGTIATDRILPILPFAHEWMEAVKKIKEQFHELQGRDMNFRIYNDFEALTSYQIRGISRARDALVENA